MKLFLAITLVAAVSGGLLRPGPQCFGVCGNQGSKGLCKDVCASLHCNWDGHQCSAGASFKALRGELKLGNACGGLHGANGCGVGGSDTWACKQTPAAHSWGCVQSRVNPMMLRAPGSVPPAKCTKCV